MPRLWLILVSLFLIHNVWAHPQGELSVNRVAFVEVSAQKLRLTYFVDFGELAATAELKIYHQESEHYATQRLAKWLSSVRVTLEKQPLSWSLQSAEAHAVTVDGGVPTLQLVGVAELVLPACQAECLLRLQDANFSDRLGWRSFRLRGHGVSFEEPSSEELVLRVGQEFVPFVYEGAPPFQHEASVRLRVREEKPLPSVAGFSFAEVRREDPLVAIFARGASDVWLWLAALLGSTLLGAAHALAPGHGKGLVAASLVGERGTLGHAVLLGLVVTLTHVSSVVLLGAVALLLSEYVVPARLYPWLGLCAGLGVVWVGLSLVRSRARALRVACGEQQEENASEGQGLMHWHGGYAHTHTEGLFGHRHVPQAQESTRRSLFWLGVSGGLVPCPSALVVLLAAISAHQLLFGMALIAAFSLGLATVLVALGVVVVKARHWLSGRGRVASWLPWLAWLGAYVVVLVGLVMMLRAAAEGAL